MASATSYCFVGDGCCDGASSFGRVAAASAIVPASFDVAAADGAAIASTDDEEALGK